MCHETQHGLPWSLLCRILGARVSDLEKKLKTLELTGLWNVSGKCHPLTAAEATSVRCTLSEEVLNLRHWLSLDGQRSDTLLDCNNIHIA